VIYVPLGYNRGLRRKRCIKRHFKIRNCYLSIHLHSLPISLVGIFSFMYSALLKNIHCHWRSSYEEGMVVISLTSLTPPLNLCLSQVRTWFSNFKCRGLLFVYSELRLICYKLMISVQEQHFEEQKLIHLRIIKRTGNKCRTIHSRASCLLMY
jgi:hypothetical protein